MEQSYLNEKKDFNETQSLKPQEFNLNGGLFNSDVYSSISLFPVPQDNAVGTNDMHNAITLISFPKGKINFDKYFRNAVEDIGGSSQYLPVISKDQIGLGQTRSFIIYDFKKKIHREYYITISLAKTIEKIATADARQRHFIFEMEGHTGNSPDPWDTASTLQLMDLSGEELRRIKQISRKAGVTWSVVSDRIFLWDYDDKKVQVLNMSLEPAHHPLEDVIKQNKENIRFMRIHTHPTLPFAILSGGKYGPVLLSWGEGRDKTPHLINSSAQQISISPDGKWVTFRREIDSNTERTYLMPISEKYPNYLGSPILLLNTYFNDNKFAWTTNPTSLVGSKRGKIYRWDMENQDFPEKGTMTYHDYVVREDLKKLIREKKQGLGKK